MQTARKVSPSQSAPVRFATGGLFRPLPQRTHGLDGADAIEMHASARGPGESRDGVQPLPFDKRQEPGRRPPGRFRPRSHWLTKPGVTFRQGANTAWHERRAALRPVPGQSCQDRASWPHMHRNRCLTSRPHYGRPQRALQRSPDRRQRRDRRLGSPEIATSWLRPFGRLSRSSGPAAAIKTG